MLFVEGELTTDQIGETAAADGIVLHELSLQRGSLEAGVHADDRRLGRVPRTRRARRGPDVTAAPPISGVEVAAGPKEDN